MAGEIWCSNCGRSSCDRTCVVPITAAELERELKSVKPPAHGGRCQTCFRAEVRSGYGTLAWVMDQALEQAQAGKGVERHAAQGESFDDQQIVQLGEWMGLTGSTHFAVGQACKKALESTRLPDDRAIIELKGAMVYLAGAITVIMRREGRE